MDAPAVGTLFAERYRIERSLGKGGMSHVYVAFDTALQRKVAIKLIRFELPSDDDERYSEIKRRFRLEVLAAARLRSSHIVTAHDLGIADGDTAYIVRDLVEGANLDHLLDRDGKLDPRRVVTLAVQACEALSEAHSSGILHRDIKPSNLFVTKTPAGDDHLVLLDFGIAKLLGEDQVERTDPGLVVGTPLYMAPEQIAGEALDPRADLYALGATVYQMLAGHPPFPMQGRDFWSVIQKKIDGRPPLPLRVEARVSLQLERVILRCLKRRPEDRYGSAAELREALLATPEVNPEKAFFELAAPRSTKESESAALFSLNELKQREEDRVQDEAELDLNQAIALLQAAVERARKDPDAAMRSPGRPKNLERVHEHHKSKIDLKARLERRATAPGPIVSDAPLAGATTVSAPASDADRSTKTQPAPVVKLPPPAVIGAAPLPLELAEPQAARKSAKGPLLFIVALAGVAAVVIGSIQLGWWVAAAAAGVVIAGIAIAFIASRRRDAEVLRSITFRAIDSDEPAITQRIRIVQPPPQEPLSPPPEAKPAGEPIAPPDLVEYLDRVGLQITESRGAVLLLSRLPGSLLPDASWAAVALEPEIAPDATLATASFQASAGPLYALSGAAERPLYVIALLRSPPGAGVYREWHELSVHRHLHILALSPREIRTHLDPGSATDHLLHLLQGVQRDPFELEGPVASEVDFFGSRAEIQALLRRAVSGKGFGLFGQLKWGTTSLLLRLRAALGNRATAWVDLASIQEATLGSLFDAVGEDLARDLQQKAPHAALPRRPAGDSPHVAREALHSMIDACHAAGLGRPVIFLDRVDQLTRGARCDPATLIAFVRDLCRLAFPRGTTRAVLVLAGADDDVLLRQTFSHGELTLDNPFYRSLDREYTPFFTREETADFLERLGARAGLVFSQPASQAAYRLTGGHKYLTRLLGSELCKRHARKGAEQPVVEAAEVDDCISPLLIRHGDYFAAIFDKAPEATRDVLARLTEGPALLDDLLRLGTPNQARKGQVPAIVFVTKYHLAVEEKRTLRLAVGLAGEWLKLGDPTSVRKPPAVSPGGTIVMPSARELSALRDTMSRGFQQVHELKLLAADMHVVLSSVTSTEQPVPAIILDLVHWSVANGRFSELRTLVRRERPHLFED